jgi:hypothetical protein
MAHAGNFAASASSSYSFTFRACSKADGVQRLGLRRIVLDNWMDYEVFDVRGISSIFLLAKAAPA